MPKLATKPRGGKRPGAGRPCRTLLELVRSRSFDAENWRHRRLLEIEDLPADEQFGLAHEILRDLGQKEPTPEQRREAFKRLEGILATDAPPPTDEEVERILEEERMRKYG